MVKRWMKVVVVVERTKTGSKKGQKPAVLASDAGGWSGLQACCMRQHVERLGRCGCSWGREKWLLVVVELVAGLGCATSCGWGVCDVREEGREGMGVVGVNEAVRVSHINPNPSLFILFIYLFIYLSRFIFLRGPTKRLTFVCSLILIK